MRHQVHADCEKRRDQVKEAGDQKRDERETERKAKESGSTRLSDDNGSLIRAYYPLSLDFNISPVRSWLFNYLFSDNGRLPRL